MIRGGGLRSQATAVHAAQIRCRIAQRTLAFSFTAFHKFPQGSNAVIVSILSLHMPVLKGVECEIVVDEGDAPKANWIGPFADLVREDLLQDKGGLPAT